MGLYQLYRFQINQIRRKEAFKLKEIENKQLLAETKQKEVELKLLASETETAVLRLQMNPHFIFNSMSSISSYILQKDVEMANEFLVHFSKLMRKILDFAAEPFLCISDEIDLLETYLEIEKMRLPGGFSYHLRIDENIDPEDVKLPTMILQPFVENAIWHGLASVNYQRVIHVGFQVNQKTLICTVEDNGKGINSTLEKSANSFFYHESKSLSITRKRIKLLGQKENFACSLDLIDKKNAGNSYTGTIVRLCLPLMYLSE